MDLKTYLLDQNKETLVNLILDRLDGDPQWREALVEVIDQDVITPLDRPEESELFSVPIEAREAVRTLKGMGSKPRPVDLASAWDAFERLPFIHNYQALKQAAGATWPEWKEKAVTCLRDRADAVAETLAKSPRNYNVSEGREVSVLVECLLWEEDVPRAVSEAKRGDCPGHLWLRLADAASHSYPQDALGMYMLAIDNLISLGNPAAYREAHTVLAKIQTIMDKLSLQKQFQGYVGSLAKTYSSKHSFKAGLVRFRGR
jgi:hypothetical protein